MKKKSVVAKSFIRNLKYKIYRYKTAISKNVYIDKLAQIVTQCNSTIYTSITIKPVDVKSTNYINSPA